MVVDCGGGTVDITVHEITSTEGQLKELFKATGGPYGSVSKYLFLVELEPLHGHARRIEIPTF